MQGFLKKNKMKQPRYINSKFCCIDDALLLDSFMLQNSGNARKWSAYFKVKTACGSHHDFQDRVLLLTWKLLNQRFLVVKLKSSHFKIYMVAIMSYRSFIYLFPLGIQLSRGKGWNLLNRFNPAPCVSACHKLWPGCPTLYIVVFQAVEVRGDCLWYWWPSPFKLSFQRFTYFLKGAVMAVMVW